MPQISYAPNLAHCLPGEVINSRTVTMHYGPKQNLMSGRTPQNKKDQLKTQIETSMSDIKTKKTNKEQQSPQLNKIIVTIGSEL